MTLARLRARWVVPVASPPVADGAVLMDGVILDVGRNADVAAPAGVPTLDLGDVVLLPGLVNTHAHLELTALEGLVHVVPFREWIHRVRTLKDALDADALRDSAERGVRAQFAAGITTIGDTGSSGAAAAAMRALGASGIAYQEVFGPDPAQCAASMNGLEAEIAHLAPVAGARVTIGVSPHAPYTVSGDLFGAVAVLARSRGLKAAMHLAESREETAFVTTGTGPFAEALAARGIGVHARHVSPVAWVAQHGLLDTAPLLIHCVQCDGADIAAIARAGASVAHCPHSNAELGHGTMNLAAMLAAGVRVGLGTDSVVTGAPVDLFREARLARDGAGLTPEAAVRLMTEGGAAALGVAGIARLAVGAHADLTAIAAAGWGDPFAAVLAASPERVRATWAGGTMVWDALS